MAKETTKAVALTTQSMEDAGIKTQINQNDIIDIVVSDQVEKIKAQGEELTQAGERIYEKYKSVLNGHKEKFLKELQAAGIAPGDATVEDISGTSSGYNSINLSRISFTEDTYSKVEGMMKVQLQSGRALPPGAFELTLSYNLTEKKEEASPIKGVMFSHRADTSWTKKVKIPEKTMAPIHEELKKANKDCQDFYALFPDGRFNPNKIAREAKNKINKRILKNQAPAIAEQLNSLFELTL